MNGRTPIAIALTMIAFIPVSIGVVPLLGISAAAFIVRSGMVLLACIAVTEGLLITYFVFRSFRNKPTKHQLESELKEATSTPGAEFGSRLINAQEQERTRIARELHDDINQRLVLLANGLESLRHPPGGIQSAESKSELERLWKLVNEIAIDIQHISHQLHPSKLYYLGLSAALRDLCHEFSRQRDIEVECNVRDVPVDLDESTTLGLYRTAQEALRNITKHSQARHVKVELGYESGLVRLRVSDDGVGFTPRPIGGGNNPNGGLGLVSMHERLRSAGGRCFIWSRPGLGTQVEASVPIVLKQDTTA